MPLANATYELQEGARAPSAPTPHRRAPATIKPTDKAANLFKSIDNLVSIVTDDSALSKWILH